MAIDADLPTVSLDELLRNEKANSCADRSRARIRAKRQISPVYGDLYGAFEDEARERLRGRDEGDWPILATALGLACPLWSEDADFFGTGIAVWDYKSCRDLPQNPHWSRAAGARVRANDLALAVSGQGLCTFQVGRGKGRGYIGEHWPTSGE